MLSGIMQMAETQKGNDRVYPQAILEREVANYAKLVKERRALGELDHPDSSVINLANASQNASAARSRIADADYAKETTELARTQIIAQAGTAMLAQANQQALSVMALLK